MDDDSILVSMPTTKHDQEEGDALVDTHTHTYKGDRVIWQFWGVFLAGWTFLDFVLCIPVSSALAIIGSRVHVEQHLRWYGVHLTLFNFLNFD
jgi:hypothetical protein